MSRFKNFIARKRLHKHRLPEPYDHYAKKTEKVTGHNPKVYIVELRNPTVSVGVIRTTLDGLEAIFGDEFINVFEELDTAALAIAQKHSERPVKQSIQHQKDDQQIDEWMAGKHL